MLYNASGTTDDWTYDTLGIASGHLVRRTGFLPAYSCMDAYEANNLPGLFYDAAAARASLALALSTVGPKESL